MKLKSSMKWAIAAAATVTTVTVSMGVIASAYPYDQGVTSGDGFGILGDSNDSKIGSRRNGYDFEFTDQKPALEQVSKFALSVDIPAQATIKFGGYNKDGSRNEFGSFSESGGYNGDLVYSLTADNKAVMANGKFWMELEKNSYTIIEFKSIKFYDKNDRCILYGCAKPDLKWDADKNAYYGPWTFYMLKGPRPVIAAGIQNSDGTYAMKAEVMSGGLAMSVGQSNGANWDACEFKLSDAVQTFTMNGTDVTGNRQIAFNSAEGAVNEYKFVCGASVALNDPVNKTKITLYSVDNELTVTLADKLRVVTTGEPQLVGDLPQIDKGDFESAEDILDSFNNATRDKSVPVPDVGDAYVDSSVTDDTALFSRVLIPGLDGSKDVIAKVVYDEVLGFDPDSHKAQAITLKGHIVANDIEFQNGNVIFEAKAERRADYIDSVKISKLPASTELDYLQNLSLDGGELTITYNSNDKETVSMTDARVSASGFYGENGELPAKNSKVVVTVTYTADGGAYDPDRPDGARFSDTFTVTVRDLPKLDAPVITPNGGKFSKSVKVSITAQNGAKIYYTTDGSDPTANSTEYSAPFTVTGDTTVKAIAVRENCYDSQTATAEFTRNSGSSGGNRRPSSSSDKKTDSTPMMDGKAMSWDDIYNYLNALPDNSSVKISLNGNTTVPAKIAGVIRDKKHTVEFVYDSVKSWVVRGANVGTASVAEFAILPGNADSSVLRGVFGADLRIGGTNVPAELKLYFRDVFAGQFANIYKTNGGVLEFQRCVKVGKDGSAIIPGADAAGGYVVMVCGFSDLPGDMSNDGVLNAMDASAVLKDIVGLESGVNPLMADFNGDGNVNAMDASAILKRIVGLI
jgi:hypothetical protein